MAKEKSIRRFTEILSHSPLALFAANGELRQPKNIQFAVFNRVF